MYLKNIEVAIRTRCSNMHNMSTKHIKFPKYTHSRTCIYSSSCCLYIAISILHFLLNCALYKKKTSYIHVEIEYRIYSKIKASRDVYDDFILINIEQRSTGHINLLS